MSSNRKDPLESPKIRLAVSFLIAVAIWLVVVTFFSTDTKKVIKDVPINKDYNASYLNLGIEIVQQDIETVDITVSGPRRVVGSLKPEDIIVYPVYTNVRAPGKYELPLNAFKVSSIKEFQIDSISNYKMSADFDRLIEKNFEIEVDASNITIEKGYMVDKMYVTPGNVLVKGAESKLNNLDKIVAKVEPQQIAQSAQLPAQLTFYDKNGEELDSSYFILGQSEFVVTVPVLKEVELPVKVSFINLPVGFDSSIFDVELSEKTIKIAVPSKVAENITEFIVGYIDVKNIELDKPYVFEVVLPAGYRNINDVTQVSANISSKNIGTKEIDVDNIKIINKGQNDIEIITKMISSVEIVGEKSAVEKINGESVIALLDISKVSLAQGKQTVPVDIIVPTSNTVYASGTYYVTIKKV